MRPFLTILLLAAVLLAVVSCKWFTSDDDQVDKPVFNITSGTYDAGVEIVLTCATAGAEIRYTLDGTDPTKETLVYAGPIVLEDNSTIRARAYKAGSDPSGIAAAVFEIIPGGQINVPAGSFNNGSGTVTLSAFQIGRYEVTQASYESVMGANPSSFAGHPDFPVEQATWFNAIEYCNRRSLREGLTPCYSYLTHGTNPANWPEGWSESAANHANVSCDWSTDGYRLPTEMEWLYAARGGSSGQGLAYSGSDNLDEVGWYFGNSGATPHPVGGKAANGLGVYDMSGNVWEWCWDIWNDTLPTSAQTDPTGPATGNLRCIRGGSWGSYDYFCALNHRDRVAASNVYFHDGFRVCRRN